MMHATARSVILIGLVAACTHDPAANRDDADPGPKTDDPTSGGSCDTGDPLDVMVRVGQWCVDKFEAVICDGAVAEPGRRASCLSSDNGSNDAEGSIDARIGARGKLTARSYRAFSRPGVTPTRFVNKLQALSACANAGKWLVPDALWVTAALGTPDPGANDGLANAACNTDAEDDPATGFTRVRRTGDGVDCASQWGAQDMVGNLWEWTDGIQSVEGISGDGPTTGDDMLNLVDVSGEGLGIPAGTARGGSSGGAQPAGVFAFSLNPTIFRQGGVMGFRCARPLPLSTR